MGVTTQTPEFRAKFPLGKVPVFEGADGFCLAESIAIATYIAQSGPRADQLLGRDAKSKAKITEWSVFSEVELIGQAQPWLLTFVGMVPFNAETHGPAAERFQRALGKIEATVADGRKFLVGDELTLADILVASHLFTISLFLLDADMRKAVPKTIEWLKGIAVIPEVAKYYGEYKPVEKRIGA